MTARRKFQHRSALRTSGRSFDRSLGQRSARKSVLIICEDQKNAPQYFRALCHHLKINSATVQIPPNAGSAPISVVDFAEEKYHRDGGYDHVFCVFDKDQHESYRRAIQKVNGLISRTQEPMPILAVTAVPCFELWILLHFERTDRPMRTCAEVVKKIKQHVPGYMKGESDITNELLTRTKQAVANARWLIKQQAAAGTDNPSTRIHEIVSTLIGLANSQ